MMRKHRISSFLSAFTAIVLCGGCVTQSSFPNRMAEAYCDKSFECSKALSGTFFQSPENCVKKVEGLYEGIVSDCKDWDGKRAAKCIDQVEKRECGSWQVNLEPCADLAAICK